MSKKTSGPGLAVAIAAVRRIQANDKYIPRDYEVCLVREGGGLLYGFPRGRVGPEENPDRIALHSLRQLTHLSGTTAYPLMAHGKPHGSHSEHVIALFYVVPVSVEGSLRGHSSVEARFHPLSEVLENRDGSYQMEYGHREMLYALDQWLRERHVIPFVNPDLVFLCSQEGEGVGGLIKAVIDNPVYNAHVRPPEDKLVIALNNPVFHAEGPHELDTAVVSNA